jgi:hypothetical protein
MHDLLQRTSEVERRVISGFHAVDHGQRIDEPDITDDFTLTLGQNTLSAGQYRTFLLGRADVEYVTRHLVANFHVVEDGGDTLTVAFSAAVYRRDTPDGPASVVVSDFVDVWVARDGSWLQRSRTITPVLTTGPGAP